MENSVYVETANVRCEVENGSYYVRDLIKNGVISGYIRNSKQRMNILNVINTPNLTFSEIWEKFIEIGRINIFFRSN